jgi:hypothetical protein
MYLKSFVIKGERCSGTNYLEKLLETNLRITPYATPEWKHGYFSLSATDNFGESIDYLTIIIFRDVFDWLRSFYLTPHHLEGANSGCWRNKPAFSEFIRRKVKMIDGQNNYKNMDRHPFSLDNPKNLLELRKWKTENWLNYKKLQKPVCYLKYEDLAENPEKIIREINDTWFNIDFVFENWKVPARWSGAGYKKDTNLPYQKNQKYFDISKNDTDYLIKNIDWDLERKIGYSHTYP